MLLVTIYHEQVAYTLMLSDFNAAKVLIRIPRLNMFTLKKDYVCTLAQTGYI